MNIFTIGDIHGNLLALKQCLERSKFNYENDQLIVLGDVVDGYPQSKECVELLMEIPNLIYIIGNHDQWYIDWCKTGAQPMLWRSQGGMATLASYNFKPNLEHLKFFEKGVYHYIDDSNRLFVHGGIYLGIPIKEHSTDDLMWNRDLVKIANANYQMGDGDLVEQMFDFKEIFVGHSTTEMFNSTVPIEMCGITMMDCGAGYNGKLSIMNVDTHEYWQSDNGDVLYGPNQGRY